MAELVSWDLTVGRTDQPYNPLVGSPSTMYFYQVFPSEQSWGSGAGNLLATCAWLGGCGLAGTSW